MSEASARSTRVPWTRALPHLVALVLLPFPWQLRGCGPTPGEHTGLELLRGVEFFDQPAGLLLLGSLAFVPLSAWIALELSGEARRVAVHAAGALASAFLLLAGTAMIAGVLDSSRVLPAGAVVLAALAGGVVDGVLRLALAIREWRARPRVDDG